MADVIGTANSGAEAQAGWLLDVLGVDLAALRPLPPGPEGEPEYRLARGTLARREAAVKRIGDMPAPQKLLKDSYLEQAALVQAQLDIPDYVAAALLLPELQTRIGAAYAARRKGFEDAVEAKVMIAKQLQRVKATDEDGDPILDEDGDPEKAWKAPGSPEWVAMVDATLDIQLDPDFQADYDEVCDQVAGLLAADPLIQEIARDWQAIVGDFHSTDLQDKAAAEKRVKAFGDRVLKLQSQTLGIDPPTAFEFKPDPDDPESMGGYNGGTGRIDLNSAAPGNWSLREFLDTLTHENTHAYQEKLIRLLDGTALLPGEVQLQSGDSEYCAALALKLNDNAGYVSFDESEEYPDDTHEPYMEQVCEVQAWRAGERAGKGAWKKLQKVPR